MVAAVIDGPRERQVWESGVEIWDSVLRDSSIVTRSGLSLGAYTLTGQSAAG